MKSFIDLHCVIIFQLILCYYMKSSVDLHCVIIKLFFNLYCVIGNHPLAYIVSLLSYFLTYIVSLLLNYFSTEIVSLYEIVH